jgi:hypothetical protein
MKRPLNRSRSEPPLLSTSPAGAAPSASMRPRHSHIHVHQRSRAARVRCSSLVALRALLTPTLSSRRGSCLQGSKHVPTFRYPLLCPSDNDVRACQRDDWVASMNVDGRPLTVVRRNARFHQLDDRSDVNREVQTARGAGHVSGRANAAEHRSGCCTGMCECRGGAWMPRSGDALKRRADLTANR